MTTSTRQHRIVLSLSPAIDLILSDYASLTGQNKTTVVTNLLLVGVPALASALSVIRGGYVSSDASTNEVVRVIRNV